ncbi:anthranilate synthase component I [Kocuria sp. TGY1127_2]|uniref:anthranilate synthase component I n=1 Tax=Kocuria sp. TGY1127_2 TaxID=2711328 RepID=UPI0015BF51CC|nr:anthranilate synthase component I [Kocuria sp. TGY1127_2]
MTSQQQELPGQIRPTREEFRELAAQRRVVPVSIKVVADSLTPIGIYRSLVARDGQAKPGTFLLESANAGAQWSRYSFIGVSSRSTLTTKDGKPFWQGTVPEGARTNGSPVDAIRDTLEMLHTEPFEDLPPLTSGLVGYLGWDTVRHWEKLPHPPTDDLNLPEFALNLVSDMAIHDHKDGSVTLVANAINWDGTSERVDWAYDDAVSRVHSMLKHLAEPLGRTTVSYLSDNDAPANPFEEDITETWSRQQYMNSIVEGKHAIHDGDIFQIVISRRFEAETDALPLDVYRVLRQTNPSPYMYLYTFEDPDGEPYSIVGSSPEALVTVSGDRATTHPIAGSRPRGDTHAHDVALAEELLADEKERSEHLMLVDLSRNDLSKIASPGTVAVTQFMEIERFSHIMHISSTVEARIREDANAYDVLRATFPAGTLSGAPKPRAMQLLDDYEPHRRGVYGGVVGYFDFAGNMDMAIAIRTALLKNGRAYVQAGAGIVADSVPDTEADETVSKAAAPLRAVLRARNLMSLAEEDRI